MPGVLVRDNEPFERALKRFKKACEKAGVISDMKKNQHFEKPSERRKRKNCRCKTQADQNGPAIHPLSLSQLC